MACIDICAYPQVCWLVCGLITRLSEKNPRKVVGFRLIHFLIFVFVHLDLVILKPKKEKRCAEEQVDNNEDF